MMNLHKCSIIGSTRRYDIRLYFVQLVVSSNTHTIIVQTVQYYKYNMALLIQ